MPIKRTPAHRVGITKIPEHVTVTLADDEGRAAATAEDAATIGDLLEAAARSAHFETLVAATEAWARETIERHGGERRARRAPTEPGLETAGYFIPAPVQEASELWYAVRLIQRLTFARSPDRNEALCNAWSAASLATEAHLKFGTPFERLATIGQRVRFGGRKGAAEGNSTRSKKAAENRATWELWARTAPTVKAARTHEAKCKRIAAHFGAALSTVKAAMKHRPW
jgi:hypothetical protein